MSAPKTTVIIPTYNRRSRLESAIESCLANSDDVDVQIIVVDDGSTDGTREWLSALQDHRIRTILQPNQGAPAARNAGLESAEGRYIKFLDDDDELAPRSLQTEIERLEGTDASLTYGAVQIRTPSGTSYTRISSDEYDLVGELMRDGVAAHPHAFLYHRSVLDGVWWDETLTYYQDTDFIFRVASRGVSATRLEDTVALHNRHEGDRITTRVKRSRPVIEQQKRRIETILRSLETLREHGALHSHHRQAAAEGIWRWAYMAAPYDFSFFRDAIEKADTIYPGFRPDRGQPVLEWLDRHIGPQKTEALINPLRRAKRYLYA